MLTAVILAAGESRRMGSPKALLPHQGRPFLQHLIDVTRHPRIGFTRVVLGANAEEIREQLTLDPATVVVNPQWEQGQLSSLQAALGSLPTGTTDGIRSEERRVGKECRSRWSQYHEKEKRTKDKVEETHEYIEDQYRA